MADGINLRIRHIIDGTYRNMEWNILTGLARRNSTILISDILVNRYYIPYE